MGLTQTRLAQLSGLSRATINQIENGSIKDLSLTRTARLLEVLGLSINISPARPQPPESAREKTPASILASRTASVSYRDDLPPDVLKASLLTGQVPSEFVPHLNALLEDASVILLSRVVDELNAECGVERAQIWANMRSMARKLGSRRDIWG
ncbi:regulatory protein [Caldimonas brevitalea]|uniref:Regulatory protein n=2 Tax=Caldimonas brevitalea TaxID=413882 RepID=A0A0G3BE32_9BURK|nr:regulatory protein [Caldimonas brevitalea]